MQFLPTILPELIKQSVLAGTLLVILFVLWRFYTKREEKKDEQIAKKDDAIYSMMSDHSTKLLAQQEKTIESHNALASAISKQTDTMEDFQETILRELDGLKGKKTPVRPLNSSARPQPAA